MTSRSGTGCSLAVDIVAFNYVADSRSYILKMTTTDAYTVPVRSSSPNEATAINVLFETQ